MKIIRWIAMLAILMSAGVASAVLYPDWDVASGDWSTAASWDGGDGDVEPTVDDYAYINNGGTANITQAGEVAARVYAGSASGGTGTVNMTSGDLTVGTLTGVGWNSGGVGTFTISGGTHSTARLAVAPIGDGAGTIGTYTQSGGTTTVTGGGGLDVGRDANSKGTVTISGGSFSVGGRVTLGGSNSDGAILDIVGSDCSTITVGEKFIMTTSSTLKSEIDSGGITLIDTTSNYAQLAGTWTVTDAGTAPATGTFKVLEAEGGFYGSFNTINLPAGWSYSIDDTATVDSLYVTVPEPASIAMLLLVAGLGIVGRRMMI